MFNEGMFGSDCSNWVVFDVYQFYLDKYESLRGFGIAHWHTENSTVSNKCRAVNFAKLESIDYNALVFIISECISLEILPDIDEIMSLKHIPMEWVKGRISILSDFYSRFYVGGQSITELVKFFDEHIDLNGNNKLTLKLMSWDSEHEDGFGEKNLYLELRDNMDLTSLRCFNIEFALYLSELIDDDGIIDANAIIRKIADKEKMTGKRYLNLIYDVKNLLRTNNNADAAAAVVITAAKRGIVVDFSKDSEHFEVHVYNKLYRRIYDFTSAETFVKSLKKIHEIYGENFFLSDNFRKYYPIKLKYVTNSCGEEDIIIEGVHVDGYLDLEDFDPEGSMELLKLAPNLYKVNPRLMVGINCPYRLISSVYIMTDEMEFKERPQLTFLG